MAFRLLKAWVFRSKLALRQKRPDTVTKLTTQPPLKKVVAWMGLGFPPERQEVHGGGERPTAKAEDQV